VCVLETFTRQFLDAVQLEEGPAHTEITLTSRGPRVIESHDRPGGDRINELVRVAYDVDLKAIALGGPSGLVPVLQSSPPLRGCPQTRSADC
jgi:hypothetical protein